MHRISYKFELRPNAEQRLKAVVFAGQCRFVFNELLARSKENYKKDVKQSLTAFGMSYEITKLKVEFEWLSECHVHCLQESGKALSLSYQRWFKWLKTRKGPKAGPPKFKSKRSPRSFSYKTGIKVHDNNVWLPKIGWVRFRKSREVLGKIKTATVKQSPAGKWFVSLSCEQEMQPLPKTNRIVGIDLGLSHFAITSEGEKYDNPRWLRRSQRKLKRLQQSLSRKKKGSSNRAKARIKVARQHEQVANQRKDFQHKLSTKLINENQVIGIEDLSLKGLVRTRLAKSFSDAGLGEFVRQLEYKADWYGRDVVKADRFFPSSKTCNCCGEINDSLSLSDRSWKCKGCGTEHDRDINAAINLKNIAVGHTEMKNACGGSVSHA